MQIYLLFCYTFVSDLRVHDVRLIRMLNYIIFVLYSNICSYISITIDDVTSCMYCGVHVGALDLLLTPGVTRAL
jgi:hypothetical protein